jgi:hypothetical protein
VSIFCSPAGPSLMAHPCFTGSMSPSVHEIMCSLYANVVVQCSQSDRQDSARNVLTNVRKDLLEVLRQIPFEHRQVGKYLLFFSAVLLCHPY